MLVEDGDKHTELIRKVFQWCKYERALYRESCAMDYKAKRTEWLQELPWIVERVLREGDTIIERKRAVELIKNAETVQITWVRNIRRWRSAIAWMAKRQYPL